MKNYILKRISIDPKTECCNWTLSANRSDGYGKACYKGYTTSAHRLSYLAFNGEIPDGLLVLHTCDNPKCVNPKHLIAGTQKQNIQDCVKKGRDIHRRKLTPEDVQMIKEADLSLRDLAAYFEVSYALVGRIKRGEVWTHI